MITHATAIHDHTTNTVILRSADFAVLLFLGHATDVGEIAHISTAKVQALVRARQQEGIAVLLGSSGIANLFTLFGTAP